MCCYAGLPDGLCPHIPLQSHHPHTPLAMPFLCPPRPGSSVFSALPLRVYSPTSALLGMLSSRPPEAHHAPHSFQGSAK